MNLSEKINEDLKTAMKAQDEVAKLTIRGIKKELIEAKTAPGASGELSDEDVLKIIAKLLKQRKESASLYQSKGRDDLAQNELAEATILESYLPKQMSPEELEAVIHEIIGQTGAQGPKDMGKVMGVATKQLAGKADGRLISETVKSLLNAM
jgi:uncharacterized protein YqeY